ncbi:hypothetical protein WJN01_12115 [Flavobacteriaceae bacterium SZ-1-7]|uniref:hypothetical protein n=1 Tax=Tamlana sedimenti TaxID=3134126 RepID=UPI0031244CA8
MKNLRKLILIATLIAFNMSCSTEEGCAKDNTGTVIIENANTQYSLHFYKSSPKASNTPGDLVVEPKSKGNIDLSAGSYTTHIKLFTGGCNDDGSRCWVSWSVLDDNKVLDLSSCEDLNLTF